MKTSNHRLAGTEERARLYLDKVSPAVSGQDGHGQTFAVACALVHGFALDEHTALGLLREYNATCQPPWSERELEHKVKSAGNARHSKPRGHLLGNSTATVKPSKQNKPKIPKRMVDPATATENFLKGFRASEADLWELSPIRPGEDWTQDGRLLVESLYAPGEKINFVTNYQIDQRRKAIPGGCGRTVERNALLAEWAGGMPLSDAGGWLRMNPLDGKGTADVNVTSHRFGLVEIDSLPLDLQLSLLCRLPLPVSAILTSGGRSVHAWVKIAAPGPDSYKALTSRMLQLLAKFGVDGKNKNPSRLSRLPGVSRKIGADGDGKQRILYLNPAPSQKGIL